MTAEVLPDEAWGLVVIGYGNDPMNGPSTATINNGKFAARFVESHLSDPTVMPGFGTRLDTDEIYAASCGPRRDCTYPVTEAQAMADAIEERNPGVHVKREERSTTTIENMEMVAHMLGSKVGQYFIISADPHVHRAVAIARKVMPKLHFAPVPTDRPLTGATAAKEHVLRLYYEHLTRDATPRNIADLHATYRKRIEIPKKAMIRLGLKAAANVA